MYNITSALTCLFLFALFMFKSSFHVVTTSGGSHRCLSQLINLCLTTRPESELASADGGSAKSAMSLL